jgi:hypothetical protein
MVSWSLLGCVLSGRRIRGRGINHEGHEEEEEEEDLTTGDTGSTGGRGEEGKRGRGEDLRSGEWLGQETLPQQGEDVCVFLAVESSSACGVLGSDILFFSEHPHEQSR